MSTFVEECRQEWKRLGVPDLLADEMASDLEVDLAEARADGVPAAEILGESDPHRFAAAWASERGLVAEQRQRRSRRRLWIWLAVAFAFLVAFGVVIPVVLATATGGHSAASPVQVAPPRAIRSATVPNLVGLKACRAARIALRAGLTVRKLPRRRCNAVVLGQRPAPGRIVPRHTPQATVTLRLRRARR
jgi:hypothetical protein